ncbi:MBL fold metallo-hydrolase [archaeon]|nr:MBL fold metallo-hydrolase [archaeon]
MKFKEVDINWLGHSGFLIKNSKIIYIDPYQIKDDLPKADLILITHSHYDHCSLEDLNKIIQPGTRVLVTPDSQSKVNKFDIPVRIELVEVGQEFDFSGVKVLVLPAYNVDKPFHSKEEGLVGYLIKTNGVIIYHAGDTDKIPEMEKLTGYNQNFVALLPVGGRFTMDPVEASEAAKLIKPTVAIPMHWGTIVGTKADAIEFKELCEAEGIRVEILDKI